MPVLTSRVGGFRRRAAVTVAVSLTMLAACSESDPPEAIGARSSTTSAAPASTSAGSASPNVTAGMTTVTSAPPQSGGTAAEAWRLAIEAPVSNGTTGLPLTLCYAATGPTREATLSLAVSALAPPGGDRRRADVDIEPGRGTAVVDLGLEGDQVLDLQVRLLVGGEATDAVVSVTAVELRTGMAPTVCA